MIINKKYLGIYSPLPQLGNYDFSEIMNYVSIAQEIWLRPLIGDGFLDQLENQVKENRISDENATLLIDGGLYRYLAYATCLEGLAFIWAHFSEVGITVSDSDTSKSITLKDLTYIEAHLRRQVEFLKDSLIKWLDEHCNYYPMYHPTNCQCDKCCNNKGLNLPNPSWLLYGTKKKHTDLI